MTGTYTLQGICLRREGDHAIVEVDTGMGWVEIIREHADGAFSHIVEPAGIERAVQKHFNGSVSEQHLSPKQES